MDPSVIIPRANRSAAQDSDIVDVRQLLERQLQIASSLQEAILRDGDSLAPKELQALASTASSVIALSHRTEQLLSEISTLRLFSQTVLEFLRNRSDSLGEDLLAELREVAESMNAGHSVPGS
jgi:hypothetical protein